MYKPNSPVRDRIGQGYVLSGVVKSAKDCAPINGARIEFWQVGPNAKYDDEHRATVIVDQTGAYRFESNYPPSYLKPAVPYSCQGLGPGLQDPGDPALPREGPEPGDLRPGPGAAVKVTQK